MFADSNTCYVLNFSFCLGLIKKYNYCIFSFAIFSKKLFLKEWHNCTSFYKHSEHYCAGEIWEIFDLCIICFVECGMRRISEFNRYSFLERCASFKEDSYRYTHSSSCTYSLSLSVSLSLPKWGASASHQFSLRTVCLSRSRISPRATCRVQARAP